MKITSISGDMAVKLAIGAVALGVLWYASRKISGVASSVIDTAADVADTAVGAVTGNNYLTAHATNSDGTPQTAYQGVPVLGTLGAATNAVSGGYLADFGSWLGQKTYDLTH